MSEHLPIAYSSRNISVTDKPTNSLVTRGLAAIQNKSQGMTPEQEQKLLQIVCSIMDLAFEMGFTAFRENAKYVLFEIRNKLGRMADLIEIEHLQGAYIGMKKGITPKVEVIAFDSVEQLFLDKKLSDQRLEPIQDQTPNEFDPELMAAGLTLAGYHIERGSIKYSDYAQAMINDLGVSIQPYLRGFYETIRHYPGFDNSAMDDAEAIENLQSSASPAQQTKQPI
jgi:hypothetical protein